MPCQIYVKWKSGENTCALFILFRSRLPIAALKPSSDFCFRKRWENIQNIQYAEVVRFIGSFQKYWFWRQFQKISQKLVEGNLVVQFLERIHFKNPLRNIDFEDTFFVDTEKIFDLRIKFSDILRIEMDFQDLLKSVVFEASC